MENKAKQNKTRRKVLKGAAYGAPVVWSAPIITSVVLPVHAQTTEVEIDTEIITPVAQKFSLTNNSPLRRQRIAAQDSRPIRGITDKGAAFAQAIGNVLISTAKAQVDGNLFQFYLEQVSGDVYSIVLLVKVTEDGDINNSLYYTGQLTVGAGSIDLLESFCGYDPDYLFGGFSISSVTPDVSATVSYDGDEYTLLFDSNAVPPSNVVCAGEDIE